MGKLFCYTYIIEIKENETMTKEIKKEYIKFRVQWGLKNWSKLKEQGKSDRYIFGQMDKASLKEFGGTLDELIKNN